MILGVGIDVVNIAKIAEKKSDEFVKRLLTDSEFKKYQELKEYALDEPKVHPTAPVYSFFLMDPNGYKVEFQQFI